MGASAVERGFELHDIIPDGDDPLKHATVPSVMDIRDPLPFGRALVSIEPTRAGFNVSSDDETHYVATPEETVEVAARMLSAMRAQAHIVPIRSH